MEITGVTYSTSDYEHYNQNGDRNYFEEVVDKMILDGISGMNESFRNAIMSLDRDKKRMTILSLLDKDLNLFKRIKALTDKYIGKMEHIKDIIMMLREYVKVGEVEKKKFGEVMTPLELVKEMLATLPEDVWSNPNLKWLDPANGTGPYPIMVIYKLMNGLAEWEPDAEKRYKHIVENMIYVCELQPKNMFLYMCAVDPFDTYKLNIYTGSFLEPEFDKHMKDVWCVEKFDICIGNPPYNQMIDMDFLCKSHDISDVILYVHPSTWLLDEKGKQKKFTNTKEKVGKDLVSIELFNGNKIFGIALFVPCVISFFDKKQQNSNIKCIDRINNIELNYSDIYQINKFSNITIYSNIKEKIFNKNKENVWSYFKDKSKNNIKDYMISFTGIRGNVNLKSGDSMVQNDFYTIVSVDRKVQSSNDVVGDSFLKFYFHTENECQNFLDFLKTNISRFLVSIYKNNQNLHRGELEILPWLDFSKKWTDENLVEYFQFTQDEVDFINSKISNYYN